MNALDRFNRADDAYARTVLEGCARIPSWVEGVLAGRPYASIDDLLRRASAQTRGWTVTEIDAALADHPRIGDTPTVRSRTEQSSVDANDHELLARIAEGNRRYEELFGRIYLVRASGRTGEELLDLLDVRLGNTPEAEQVVVHDQLADIALLRLRTALVEGVSA
jgi:2-oxo-4-hydroxy-4-carboxy-5-ureidoimidazoline decarboxylase